MAPQQVRTSARVFSTQVKLLEDSSILVESGGFVPCLLFLEHGYRGETRDDEPPTKRRKLQTKKSATETGTAESDPIEEIPLFEVVFDFQFSETLTQSDGAYTNTRASETDESDALPVELCAVETDDHASTLRLTLPQARQSELVMTCTALSQETVALIRAMMQHQPSVVTRSQIPRAKSASRTSCSLTRSGERAFPNVQLRASLTWRSGVSCLPSNYSTWRSAEYDLLCRAYPNGVQKTVADNQPWTPQDFYESVYATPDDQNTDGRFEHILESSLYPFQKRAVDWMLNREGVQHQNAAIKALSQDTKDADSFTFYDQVQDAQHESCFVNHLQGIISRTRPGDTISRVSGGILAEEMGLGKTVELIVLVILHQRLTMSPYKVFDTFSATSVLPSRSTLIVTPASILQQWKAEIARHAPALKVFHYEGIPSPKARTTAWSEQTLLQDLSNKYDVVLCTYATLAKEVHHADDPPDRGMRQARAYARPRSPLVQIQWWRVCLDEAQLVESSVTAAARVACRLPRVHSWAVSGTPLKKDVQDLHGLLIFLRYKPFSEDRRLWVHVVVNHRHLFRRIIGQIALRHTKARVRNELRLPPQKRVVVTVPFSVVEQRNYSDLFASMCTEVGLTSTGSPIDEQWDSENSTTIERMRSWLTRLRQTCLHPQVGKKNRQALGRGAGPLRTELEILGFMIEQASSHILIQERALATSTLTRAHIVGNNRANFNRSEDAFAVYKSAVERATRMAADAQHQLSVAEASLTEQDEAMASPEDVGSTSESSPQLGQLKGTLRLALQLQHVATFFAATSCYQMKSDTILTRPDSDRFKNLEREEVRLYDDAKALRKELLKEPTRKAEDLMRKVRGLELEGKLTLMPKVNDLKFSGIETRRIVEKSDELFDAIRENVHNMTKWRATMADLLQKPLVDEDMSNETTGDEYEASTKEQDELYVYFDALKAAQADLNTFVTGEDAPLVDHEVKTLIRNAKTFLNPKTPEDQRVPVHAPELLLKLLAVRNSSRKRVDQVGSVRGLIQQARATEAGMQFQVQDTRGQNEMHIVRLLLDELQDVFKKYTKALAGLEKEMDLFRTVQNLRVEFYKQLQELSDTVAPYKEELDPILDQEALDTVSRKEGKMGRTLEQTKAKHRFLLRLRDEPEEAKMCIICQESLESGVMTACGHQFCKECLEHWFRESRTKRCPTCKEKVSAAGLYDVTYKTQESRAQEEVQDTTSSRDKSPGSSTQTSQASIYSDVDTKLMGEIKAIDLPVSYGTKIDTLGRHLRWIREHDPGAKSIIFSQYREFLDVLGAALSESKIGHARLGRSNGSEKFKHDPSIDCLLLDAKTDSSGLTLVNATHVFICEPLIQTAIELQAIARVHRIGQTRPTTVWMYLINGTVEEAIYELSVTRRLAHVQSRSQAARYGKSRSTTPGPLQENAIDAANSEEIVSQPLTKLLVAGKGGGELVGKDDLWQCLFGNAQNTETRDPAAMEQVFEAAELAVGRHLGLEAAEQRRGEASLGAMDED